MNFHGYQQPEISIQQVMHINMSLQEKIFRKMSGCCLKFSGQFLQQCMV